MLATVLLADYANLTGDGKLNVMGVFRQIITPTFPCRHALMYLVIKLQTEPIEELRRERVLIARLLDADGSVIQQLEMPFRFPEWRGGLRPEANFIVQINDVEFSYAGDYAWHVELDNEHLGRYAFSVSQLPA